MANTIHQHGQGDNIAGDKVMGSKIAHNNQGANIGNLVNAAKDNTQISASINQTSGITTAELLALLTNLRQIATTQFPQDIQEDLILDIEDVEAEVQKPADQRSQPRLKKRLTALLAAVTVMTGAVSGVNEFTDEVIDLGRKLGLELALPPAPSSPTP